MLIDKNTNFEKIALELFYHQANENRLYQKFLEYIHISPKSIKKITEIPFLPISLFKTHTIQTGVWQPEKIFTSSSTTGQVPSQHWVRYNNEYLANSVTGFEHFYGKINDYCVLALLPNYLERSGSSLVEMVQYFIHLSKYPESGFFLYDTDLLYEKLLYLRQKNIPILLIGVSFALIDFAEKYEIDLSEKVILMETGGMKGKRKEITREELHYFLKKRFHLSKIHSEYGMTELLSQGYSSGDGIFYPSPSLKVLIREANDPLHILPAGRTGGINIIDLANKDTIAFIATDDLGKVCNDGSFEVLGRLDAADMRGCNLMVE